MDVKADKKSWQEYIDAEVQDEREDFELQYQEAMEDYKQKLKRYKRSKSKKKKKRKARNSQENTSLLDGELHTVEPDGEHSEEHDDGGDVVAKPELPQPFDETSVREKVQQKALQSRRHPGK